MHFICLTPTHGRPSMCRNALALFFAQYHLTPHDTARLVIFDDAGQIRPQTGASRDGRLTFRVLAQPDWIPLPAKYPALLDRLGGIQSDHDVVYVVWDDDDVYLPWHLAAIRVALRARPDAGWAHPADVWSTYDERRPPLIPAKESPQVESATGRFHGALAVRGSLLHALGGWPDTDQADYDQQMLRRLAPHPRAVPDRSYCYRWQDTGRWHCSGSIDPQGRYRRPQIQEPGTVDLLVPEYDASTQHVLRWLQ